MFSPLLTSRLVMAQWVSDHHVVPLYVHGLRDLHWLDSVFARSYAYHD